MLMNYPLKQWIPDYLFTVPWSKIYVFTNSTVILSVAFLHLHRQTMAFMSSRRMDQGCSRYTWLYIIGIISMLKCEYWYNLFWQNSCSLSCSVHLKFIGRKICELKQKCMIIEWWLGEAIHIHSFHFAVMGCYPNFE